MALPAPVTTFVGRERELHDVHRLLRSARLLTLVGPGGVGKTRLAMEVLQQEVGGAQFEITFVDLTTIGEPHLVPQTVASAAGLRDSSEELVIQKLIEGLRLRDTLLVFDNCEHLVDACAELAATLMRACPRLQMLATSREPLDIDGETVYRVPPLQQHDAVALFAERARAVRPDFADSPQTTGLVAHICTRLDRIPLAVELAAARASGFSLNDIASRLDARFSLLSHARRTASPRQQTLRATLDWSYELLSDRERLMLLRLSVFAGGCSLEAIQNVTCEGAIESQHSLELVSQLVDKSLIQAEHQPDGGARYRLLESIHQYAAERWPSVEDPGVIRDRHTAFYRSLVQRSIQSPVLESDPVFAELELEHDNIRSSLRWLLDRREINSAVDLAAALGPFWFFHGHFSEGRAWLRELLDVAHSDDAKYPALLMRAGQLAWCQGDFKAARPYLEDSVRLFEHAGDRSQLAQALAILGHLLRSEGNLAGAIARYEEVLALCESVANHRAHANALLGLSQTANEQGDAKRTLAWANRTLEFAREHGMNSIAVAALQLVGAVQEREGDLSTAYDRLSESVALARSLGSRGQWWVVMGLPSLARVVGAQGNLARASSLAAEAAELARSLGDTQAMARALESRAWVAARAGQHERALRLLGAATTLRSRTRSVLGGPDKIAITEALHRSRAALGRKRAAAAVLAGQSLALEAAVAETTSTESFPPQTACSVGAPGGLTPREREVVSLVARGLSNRQIAEALVITEATAVRHISNILAKLGMLSRAQIAVWAVSHGMADPVSR